VDFRSRALNPATEKKCYTPAPTAGDPLTEAAAERIKHVMANAVQPVVGVRVGVKNGGCAGMAYTMEYAEQVERPTRWSRTRACAS